MRLQLFDCEESDHPNVFPNSLRCVFHRSFACNIIWTIRNVLFKLHADNAQECVILSVSLSFSPKYPKRERTHDFRGFLPAGARHGWDQIHSCAYFSRFLLMYWSFIRAVADRRIFSRKNGPNTYWIANFELFISKAHPPLHGDLLYSG